MEKPVKPRKTGLNQKWVFLRFVIEIPKIGCGVNGAKQTGTPAVSERFNTQSSSPNFVHVNSLP